MNKRRIILRAVISGAVVLVIALATGAAQPAAFTPLTANSTQNALANVSLEPAVAGAILGWPAGTLAPWLMFGGIALVTILLFWSGLGKNRPISIAAGTSTSTALVVADNYASAYAVIRTGGTEFVKDVAQSPISQTIGSPLWQTGLWGSPQNQISATSLSKVSPTTTAVFRASVEKEAPEAVFKTAGDLVAERAPWLINQPEVIMKAGVTATKSIMRSSLFGGFFVLGYDMLTNTGQNIGADLVNVVVSSIPAFTLAAACGGPITWASVGIALVTSFFLSATGLDKIISALVGKSLKGVASVAAGVANVAKQGLDFIASIGAGIGNLFGL